MYRTENARRILKCNRRNRHRRKAAECSERLYIGYHSRTARRVETGDG